jgi:hypothetical protein
MTENILNSLKDTSTLKKLTSQWDKPKEIYNNQNHYSPRNEKKIIFFDISREKWPITFMGKEQSTNGRFPLKN